MEAERIESFYREIYKDAKVDRSEGLELKQFFLENADCIPPAKLIWARAAAFRIAATEFFSLDDNDGDGLVSILKCINYVIHALEGTLMELRDDSNVNDPSNIDESIVDFEILEDLFRQIYADGVVDEEDNQVVIEALADYVGNIDFDAYVKLRATAFRIAAEFLSEEDDDVNTSLLRSINSVVHSLEMTLMEPKIIDSLSVVEDIGTDVSLSEAVQHLWNLDVKNRCEPNLDYFLNVQEGKKPYHSYDGADEPLFTEVNRSVLQRKTYRAFVDLLDNYVAETGVGESVCESERIEVRRFIDAIMLTAPMKYCHRYCSAHCDDFNGNDDIGYFKSKLYHMWFKLYTRERGDGADSSGFEHVFVGEIKNDKISGFHNWIRFYLEERKGNINYKGYIKPRGVQSHDDITNDDDHILTLQFEWNGVEKKVGTNLIGVSPEFEMALYTMCFLVGEEENSVLLSTGTGDVFGLTVKCYKFAGTKVGTCFVQADDHYEE